MIVTPTLTRRYIDELIGHMQRVMHPFALILGSEAEKYLSKPAVEYFDQMGGIFLPK